MPQVRRVKRVRFSGKDRTLIDGPFAETKELIAGFWIWKVNSMEDALEWLKRAPFDGGVEIELRQIMEFEDFGDKVSPGLIYEEKRLRAQMEQLAKGAKK